MIGGPCNASGMREGGKPGRIPPSFSMPGIFGCALAHSSTADEISSGPAPSGISARIVRCVPLISAVIVRTAILLHADDANLGAVGVAAAARCRRSDPLIRSGRLSSRPEHHLFLKVASGLIHCGLLSVRANADLIDERRRFRQG